MALPTSGNLTLNQIHIEAGGSSGTACTLNDTDIRGLNEASGRVINNTQGTAIEIADFYGAAQSLSFVINNGYGAYTGGGASQYQVNGWAIPGVQSKINTYIGSINSGSASSSSFFGGDPVVSAYATHHNLTGNVTISLFIRGNQANTDSVFRGFAITNTAAAGPTWLRSAATGYTYPFSIGGVYHTRWYWHLSSYFGGGHQPNFPPFWAGSYSTRILTFFKT